MSTGNYLWVCLSAILAFTTTNQVQADVLKPTQEVSGEVLDVKLEKEWPNASIITNKEDFNKLWKTWAGNKKMPEIDFKKELVLVYTCKEGRPYNATLVDRGGGDCASACIIEDKATKGFFYTFSVFKRDKVKIYDDKPVK